MSGFQFLNQTRVCTHACTCRHFLYSQLDRLTSTPKAFWLVKRDRERYCFRCDSVITQRLTQWNCSVPPKGFGPRENEHWMHLSHSLCPISFYFPVSLTHAHKPHIFRHYQTNSWNYGETRCMHQASVGVEECVQWLIRRRIWQQH